MSRVDVPGRKSSVLVVDDDPALRGLFSTLLAREGFAIDSAPNGRQAFEYLRRGAYAVILLDLSLPEVNGLELIERLERDSPSLLRRVIVLTSATRSVVESLEAKRIWGVVEKPFEVPELMRSVRECARGRRPARGLVRRVSGHGPSVR